MFAVLSSLLLGIAFAGPGDGAVPLDCATAPCTEVLPSAVRFEPVPGVPYVQGFGADGAAVGWVGKSEDIVDIKGYSGDPIVTLIGIDPVGTITGVKVLRHHEPILLIGVPPQKLIDFVGAYVGLHAGDSVSVESGGGDHTVDVISGATVTSLAENRTILDASRMLAESVGILKVRPAVPGHFVAGDQPWSWSRLVSEGAVGHLVVSNADMGVPDPHPDAAYVDLWFTIADAPQIGRALLGDRDYAYQFGRLKPDQHLTVILNSGPGSFKGSGFVRGGQFDRVRVEQGLRTLMFTDMDYTNLSRVPASTGAPAFREGAVFVNSGAALDPGAPFDLVFLGSRYTGDGFNRDFHAFRGTYRLPASVYALDGPDPEDLVWMGAWAARKWTIAGVIVYLLAIMGVFAGRRWTTARMHRLERIHLFFLFTSALGLGVLLHLQPSVTQALTLLGSAVHQWRWSLFLSDPLLFVTWVFMAIVTLVWGRGVFCGWTCPYGAGSELLFKLGRVLHLPAYELPDPIHLKARYARHGIFAILAGVFLVSPERGEMLAEVEPFKSTFFVFAWRRSLGLFAWWLILAVSALFVYRPFCRYVCPLGAALALPSSVRLSGPYRRDFCSKCKICPKGCEPRAIRPDGTIDSRECLSCMECEANWRDDRVCPPLVKIRRDLERAADKPAPAERAS